MFSREYYKVIMSTYFEKHLPTVAFLNCKHFYKAPESLIEM